MTPMIAELAPLDMKTISKDRALWIWEHVQRQDVFDDFSRGNGALFARRLIAPTTCALEYADSGLILFEEIVPKLSAVGHFFIWDFNVHEAEMVDVGRVACRFVFDKFALHRITAIPPESAKLAQRVATRMGFKYEGTLRQSFLYKGKYLDAQIYGLLQSEFNRREAERN
jgi:RimJ/RimL family protein N-acetyltransferase